MAWCLDTADNRRRKQAVVAVCLDGVGGKSELRRLELCSHGIGGQRPAEAQFMRPLGHGARRAKGARRGGRRVARRSGVWHGKAEGVETA